MLEIEKMLNQKLDHFRFKSEQIMDQDLPLLNRMILLSAEMMELNDALKTLKDELLKKDGFENG